MIRKLLLLLSLIAVVLPAQAFWPFGESQEEKDRKAEREIIELLREPNRLMNEGQEEELKGQTERAIDLYREALDKLQSIENSRDTSSEQYAPLRVKKAFCETIIDRLIFEKAEKNQRTVTMSNTSSLEARLAKERKEKSKANQSPATTNTAPVQAEVQTNVAPTVVAKPATPPKPEVVKKPNPNAPQLLRFAREMLEDGDDQECEKALRELLDAYPDHIGALQLLCLLRLEQGRREDAISAIEAALELFPTDEASSMLGAAAATSVGNFPRAMDLLDGVIKRRPKDPAPYYNMCLVLLEMRSAGNLDAAEIYYRKSVTLGGKRDARIERRLGIDQK